MLRTTPARGIEEIVGEFRFWPKPAWAGQAPTRAASDRRTMNPEIECWLGSLQCQVSNRRARSHRDALQDSH
jgi:hypothetical protein